MTVGTLVRVIRKDYAQPHQSMLKKRSGQIGVIVGELPTYGHGYPDQYEVLFWDERIETLTSVSLETI